MGLTRSGCRQIGTFRSAPASFQTQNSKPLEVKHTKSPYVKSHIVGFAEQSTDIIRSKESEMTGSWIISQQTYSSLFEIDVIIVTT